MAGLAKRADAAPTASAAARASFAGAACVAASRFEHERVAGRRPELVHPSYDADGDVRWRVRVLVSRADPGRTAAAITRVLSVSLRFVQTLQVDRLGITRLELL